MFWCFSHKRFFVDKKLKVIDKMEDCAPVFAIVWTQKSKKKVKNKVVRYRNKALLIKA